MFLYNMFWITFMIICFEYKWDSNQSGSISMIIVMPVGSGERWYDWSILSMVDATSNPKEATHGQPKELVTTRNIGSSWLTIIKHSWTSLIIMDHHGPSQSIVAYHRNDHGYCTGQPGRTWNGRDQRRHVAGMRWNERRERRDALSSYSAPNILYMASCRSWRSLHRELYLVVTTVSRAMSPIRFIGHRQGRRQ